MGTKTLNLEQVLLRTVDTELELMHSFSKEKLPIDVSTTVAMRMSRAVVSSICRISETHKCSLSEETHRSLQQASKHLKEISAVYEHRICKSSDKNSLLLIWRS